MIPESFKRNTEWLSKEAIIKGIFPASVTFTPEEADQFIDYVVDETRLRKNARVVRMDREKKNVRSIGLGSGDILWPAGNFDSTKYKTEVSAGKQVLSVQKVRGCVVIDDDDLDDNIEGEAFADHLMKMIAKASGNQLEGSFFMGAQAGDPDADAVDTDDLWDGWRKLALTGSHPVEGSGVVLDARADYDHNNGYIVEVDTTTPPYPWEFKWNKAIKALPNKYVQKYGLDGLRLFTPSGIVQDYKSSMMSRATGMGDAAILQGVELKFGEVPIVPVPLMPTNNPVEATETYGDTTLDADAAAGDTALSVTNEANFAAGDQVVLHDDTEFLTKYDHEVGEVESTAAGQVTLTEGVTYPHASGAHLTEATLDGAESLLTPRDNLVLGIKKEFKMERERKASEEATYFWFVMRADCTIMNVNACVIIKNLKER